MIFVISKFVAGMFGLDISKVQRYVLIAFIGLIAVLLLAVGLWFRSCMGRKPQLNEKQIQSAQQAIAKQDREEMQKILVESDVGEKQINANLANARTDEQNAIAEAKRKAAQMSNDELAAELERRAREQQ